VSDRQRRVLLQEGARIGEVGLGEDEQRLHAGVVGGDQAAVDEAGSRFRVRQRGDDDELVGVGDEHPLDRVGVVSRTAQDGLAGLDPHDPGKAAISPARVADDVDAVADDDALAAEFTRAHGHDDVPVAAVSDERGVAATVDGDDLTGHGVLVGRAVLAAGSRAPAVGANPHVGLVVVPRGARHHRSAVARSDSMRSHSVVNSGIVFATVPTSSTTTPRTTSPSTAPAITMRWSA
jgi:hypothetical protein